MPAVSEMHIFFLFYLQRLQGTYFPGANFLFITLRIRFLD